MSWVNIIIDFLWNVFAQIASVFYESSIFILLGFAFAGILHEFVPISFVSKRLSKPGFRSIFWATALGAPLPLCSCGVLPTAAALRRKGASKPATAAFLVSVPETGVDSIAVTYGLMGPFMAIYRPIVAVFTAIVVGIACLFITRNEKDEMDEADLLEIESHTHDHSEEHDHHHDIHDEQDHSQSAVLGFRERLKGRIQRMSEYGFRTIVDEVAFWIVSGLVVSGL